MCARRCPQRSFFDVGYPNHEMGRALERISTILDAHPEFLDWITADVGIGGAAGRGVAAMTSSPRIRPHSSKPLLDPSTSRCSCSVG